MLGYSYFPLNPELTNHSELVVPYKVFSFLFSHKSVDRGEPVSAIPDKIASTQYHKTGYVSYKLSAVGRFWS